MVGTSKHTKSQTSYRSIHTPLHDDSRNREQEDLCQG